MNLPYLLRLVVAGVICLPVLVRADDDPALLTLDRIYKSNDFQSKGVSARWLEDSSGYTTLESSQDDSGGRDIVRHDVETGASEILVAAASLRPDDESPPLSIDGYAFSQAMDKVLIYTNSQRVWRQKTRGDYWVLDRTSSELHQLGGDAPPATLMFAKFSPTGTHVAYVRAGNIYVEDLHEYQVHAITDSDSPHVINGTFDWVYEEELGLRDGIRWSPDGKQIAYWQIDTTGVRTFPLVNNTAGLYPRITEFAYPKTGEQNAIGRVGVVGIHQGPTTWIDVPGDPRNHYVAHLDWSPEGSRLILQQLNRLQNTNRVMLADPQSGQTEAILTDIDDAWVIPHQDLEWLQEGRAFSWVSERDGWSHVYVASRSKAPPVLATPGEYDVVELLHIDEEANRLYFIASPDDPTCRYLYGINIDGTGLKRLSPANQTGSHSYRTSADGRWAIHTWSAADSPPVTDLVELPGHRQVRMLEENKKLRQRFDKLATAPTEFFRVDIGNGVLLDGWCIRPAKLKAGRKYPLLVYVYGEPAGSTVVNRWGGSTALWHRMLAQQGYVVMSFDNRGTRVPRGRDWRKSIYRQVGILAPQDQAQAVQAVLNERDYLDPERVGIWGWSGGGSMSLNAIFKFPDLYHTAIAIAPVPNQRFYDTIYQERYMGLPQENVAGYRDGSAINFAQQLKGNLLLIHGTGDDNCHYQTTEMLINELIRHNKPFSMMAYPNRTHAIREGRNTTRHLRELMTSYLLDKLPPGPGEG